MEFWTTHRCTVTTTCVRPLPMVHKKVRGTVVRPRRFTALCPIVVQSFGVVDGFFGTQVEREARCAAMEADRAVNIMEHQKEIHSRPARQWIVSQHRKVSLTRSHRSPHIQKRPKQFCDICSRYLPAVCVRGWRRRVVFFCGELENEYTKL